LAKKFGTKFMANRKTHRRVGRVSGALYGAHRAKDQRVGHFITESIGGAIGGDIGAMAADWLEPAVSSWHRGAAHSCAAGGIVLSIGDTLAQVEIFCRAEAQRKAMQRSELEMVPHPTLPDMFVPAPGSVLTNLWLLACELLWRAAAGFANGLAAGYVSHLVLDAGTPRSIPLLTKGF
jgi:hypothetical protein